MLTDDQFYTLFLLIEEELSYSLQPVAESGKFTDLSVLGHGAQVGMYKVHKAEKELFYQFDELAHENVKEYICNSYLKHFPSGYNDKFGEVIRKRYDELRNEEYSKIEAYMKSSDNFCSAYLKR